MRKLLLLLLLGFVPACGPTIDREATLHDLRNAMEREIPDEETLEAHNRIVINVREGAVLSGMRRSEVEAAIGQGQECANSRLCADHGFRETDWVYDVGRRDGVAWGPTLIVGFDREGIVDGVYTLTREHMGVR
jgi:hypothetical protein